MHKRFRARYPAILAAAAFSFVLFGGNQAPASHSSSGAPYFAGMDVARDLEFITGTSTSGYVLHANGHVNAFGGAPEVVVQPSFGFDIARALEITYFSETSPAGYVLDGFGGLHRWATSGAPLPPDIAVGPYWPGWDIARDFEVSGGGGVQGFILSGWGSLHDFAADGGTVPKKLDDGPYWPGWDIARDFDVGGTDGDASAAGLVLSGWGSLHTWSTEDAPSVPPGSGGPYWPGWDIARDVEIQLLSTEFSGWVLSGWGSVYAFGGLAQEGTDGPYWAGWDIARDLELRGCDGAILPLMTLDGWGARHTSHRPACG